MAQLAASVGLPSRIGSAVWVDLQQGKIDEGLTVNIFQKDRLSLNGLLGHATFGASLGYEVAQRDGIVVTAFAGATHPWSGRLQAGWRPVAGIGVRF